MKVIIAIALLFAVAHAAPTLQDAEASMMFEGYIAKYGKSYSESEKAERLSIFRENVAMINAHNAKHARGETSYTMGINQFTDMTNDEFKTYVHRSGPFNKTSENVVILDTSNIADSVDWRTKGAVTPVKNQGQCGSCWAFSTTGSTEGAVAIATGSLKSLSEQQLVDCSGAEGNQGCNGGLMDNGFKYIIKNGGLDSESDYPYTARDGQCDSAKAAKHVSTITSFQDVQQNNEDQLAAAVAKGPVSVAIEADQAGFQHYSGGVFSGNCGTQLDHGVLVVGYTDDYWIVKNSWGATWGDNGYIQMKRGVSASGICGIAMQPSYPIAGSAPPSPPSPPSPPTPPSPPSPPSQYDYEDPKPNGCHAGEEAVQIENISGSFCSPSCSPSSPCPTNVPPGTTAQPQCALEKQGSSSPTNCALLCHILSDVDANHGCPEGAACQHVQGLTGICTYAN